MKTKIYYLYGQVLGNNIKFIREVPRKRIAYVRALFQCHCGKEFEADISQIKSFSTKSCGCLNTPEVIAARETKHGMYGHIVYRKWISMNERCYRKKADNYYKYGGRGITVYEPWHKDFMQYYNYIIALEGYNESLLKQNLITIDRIENDLHYQPGNLRITTWHIQNVNQRMQNNNTSGYVGVTFSNKHNKWKSSITVNETRIYIGLFSTKEKANEARVKYIKSHGLTEYL